MNDPHNICMNAIATATAAATLQNTETDHHLHLHHHHHQQLQPNSAAAAASYNFNLLQQQQSNLINNSPFNILNLNPNSHLLNVQNINNHQQHSFLTPNPNPNNFLPPVPHNFFNTTSSDHQLGSSSAAEFNTVQNNFTAQSFSSHAENINLQSSSSSSANFLDLFTTSINTNPSAVQSHGNYLNQLQGLNQVINSPGAAMECSSAVPAATLYPKGLAATTDQRCNNSSTTNKINNNLTIRINTATPAASSSSNHQKTFYAGHQLDQSGDFNDDVDDDCDALFNENGDGDHVISSSTIQGDTEVRQGVSTAIASTDQNAVNSMNGALQSINENRGPRGKVKGPPAKNLMAERRRRKKLNDRLYTLRSVVPKISKMDRASILGDAIDYLKELLQRINDLHNELEASPAAPLQSPTAMGINPVLPGSGAGSLMSFVKLEDCTSHSFGSNLSLQSTDSTDPLQPPKIEIRSREGQGLNIHMICARRPGLLQSIMRALDGLGLDVQQAVISCFHGFALDVFRAEQLQEHDVGADEIKRVLLLTATSTDN